LSGLVPGLLGVCGAAGGTYTGGGLPGCGPEGPACGCPGPVGVGAKGFNGPGYGSKSAASADTEPLLPPLLLDEPPDCLGLEGVDEEDSSISKSAGSTPRTSASESACVPRDWPLTRADLRLPRVFFDLRLDFGI